MNTRSIRTLFATSIVLLAGCHKGPQQGVVATVDGKPVLQTEVDKIYAEQLAANPQQSPSPDEVQAKQLQIVQELILDRRRRRQAR
jgi:peptidyl-prolyl cis-trans isomerase SurA